MCGDAEPTLPELPPLRNQVDIKNWFVDGTPDGKYALRILRVFRERCNEMWELSGDFPEGTRTLYDLMNQHQVARAKELDAAIAVLERAQMRPSPHAEEYYRPED